MFIKNVVLAFVYLLSFTAVLLVGSEPKLGKFYGVVGNLQLASYRLQSDGELVKKLRGQLLIAEGIERNSKDHFAYIGSFLQQQLADAPADEIPTPLKAVQEAVAKAFEKVEAKTKACALVEPYVIKSIDEHIQLREELTQAKLAFKKRLQEVTDQALKLNLDDLKAS